MLPLDIRRNQYAKLGRYAGRAVASLLVGVSLFVVGGCGGGSSAGKSASSPSASQTASRGASLTLSLPWPDAPAMASRAGRAFPVAANSLTVTVTDSTGYSDIQTLARPPAGSANTTVAAFFFALSPGQTSVVASAFASADGTGPVLSQASTSVVLQIGQQAGATLNFPSPISSIFLTPAAPQILPGGSVKINVSAADDRGNIFTPTGTWSTSDAAIATVDASGNVTGLRAGTVVISFKNNVFGVTGTALVTVRGGGGDAQVIVQ